MKKHLAILLLLSFAFFNSPAQSNSREWYEKGLSLKNSEKYKEAIEAFKKAVSLEDNYADALHQLGWCYNEEGLYNEAINVLKKEEMANPSDKAGTNLELAYAYKGSKKYELALPYFNKAIELNDSYSLAYKERGNNYFKLKDYVKALSDYNKYEALAEPVTDAVFYYNKGWAENDLEKYNESSKSLEKSVQLDPAYSDAFSELGYAYYKLNMNNEAITNYRAAMVLDKETNPVPILGIADVYYDNLKDHDSAMLYYAKGVQLKKTSKLAYYRLGWCYNDKGRFADAVEPLKQAIVLDAEFSDARTELGYAYYKLDKYDEALEQFRPVMNRDAKNELSRYYAGFCYSLKDDQENLKKMIDELTALNSAKYAETLRKYVK
jgi:tetratricopeptide (TPR) repeat protein